MNWLLDNIKKSFIVFCTLESIPCQKKYKNVGISMVVAYILMTFINNLVYSWIFVYIFCLINIHVLFPDKAIKITTLNINERA